MIFGIENHGNPSHYDLHIENFNSDELKFSIEYQYKAYNGHRELRPSRGRLKQSTQNRIADGYFILAAQPVGRENTHSIQHSALWRTHVFNIDHLTLLENTCIHRCSVRIPYHNITLLSCTDQQFVGKKVDIFENDRSAGCL